jgi:hypothetical protein
MPTEQPLTPTEACALDWLLRHAKPGEVQDLAGAPALILPALRRLTELRSVGGRDNVRILKPVAWGRAGHRPHYEKGAHEVRSVLVTSLAQSLLAAYRLAVHDETKGGADVRDVA